MAENSNIEWTDATWNPTTGCTRVSEGCRNCYAFQLHDMRHKAFLEGKQLPVQYAKPFKELQLFEDRLTNPLSWRKPKRIFVNSMSDLFHKDVPETFIDRVFGVMALAEWHTYQILTKRPERMAEYFSRFDYRIGRIAAAVEGFADVLPWKKQRKVGDMAVTSPAGVYEGLMGGWRSPLPSNVWLGTSVENQDAADERIPHLLRTPAAVRFLSCEPLLGPVDLRDYLKMPGMPDRIVKPHSSPIEYIPVVGIDWVIVGGESGPGARPMHPEWARSLRDQCQAAGVPFFFKQWGEWVSLGQSKECDIARQNGHNPGFCPIGLDGRPVEGTSANKPGEVTVYKFGKKAAGRLLDGREWNEMPVVKEATS